MVFSSGLYREQYPTTGGDNMSPEIARALEVHGIATELVPERGLDQGVGISLHLIYPDA